MQTKGPHYGQINGHFWAVVRANFASEGRDVEQDFSDWWSRQHVPEYVRRPGFIRGTRLRAVEADGQTGAPEHRYLAVYEVDEVESFNSALAAGPPWGPWQEEVDHYLCDWERTYYAVTKRLQIDSERGGFWAVAKVDLHGGADSAAFDRWYDEVHLSEIASNPGFHRAWRIEVEPDHNDLGPRRQRYWAVYETDSPKDFVAARARRSERGIKAWDGIWGEQLSNVQMLFYERLFEVDHAKALKERVDGG